MKSFTTLTAAITALAGITSAQVTYNSTTGTFSCPIPNGAYCASTSLAGPIIIRCTDGIGQPGNCDDNLAGYFPYGVNDSPCWETSDKSGDAACSKNCIVEGSSGNFNGTFTLPNCTPIPNPSSTTTISLPNSTTTTPTGVIPPPITPPSVTTTPVIPPPITPPSITTTPVIPPPITPPTITPSSGLSTVILSTGTAVGTGGSGGSGSGGSGSGGHNGTTGGSSSGENGGNGGNGNGGSATATPVGPSSTATGTGAPEYTGAANSNGLNVGGFVAVGAVALAWFL